MTPHEAAQRWGTRAGVVERWAALRMLPADRTPDGWRIAPHARPAYRFGAAMILRWADAHYRAEPNMDAELPACGDPVTGLAERWGADPSSASRGTL
jgi:hypothetical protein